MNMIENGLEADPTIEEVMESFKLALTADEIIEKETNRYVRRNLIYENFSNRLSS